MGISLCMIVKNEEDWLPGAVESVRSIVDEVIIVDTGSTDSTASQASRTDAKLLKIQWEDSFAQARNASLAQATQPWILVLDADERLAARDLTYIKDAARRGDADGYHLIQRNYVNGRQSQLVFGWTPNTADYEEGSRYPGYVDNPLIRLFRNSPEIRFHGSVHEIIDPTRLPSTLKFPAIPAVIHHYGKVRGEERVSAKQRFYLALGLKKIGEEPENAKAFLDLGIQYQELDRHPEACACFDQAFEMTRMPLALLYWAISEKHLHHYESAAKLLLRAIRLGLDTLHVHLELGNVQLAVGQLKAGPKRICPVFRDGFEQSHRSVQPRIGITKDGGLRRPPQKATNVQFASTRDFKSRSWNSRSYICRRAGPMRLWRFWEIFRGSMPAALSLTGAAYLEKDNIEEAQKSLEAALRKDRTLIDARINLAQIHTRKGDHARAARYLQSVAMNHRMHRTAT